MPLVREKGANTRIVLVRLAQWGLDRKQVVFEVKALALQEPPHRVMRDMHTPFQPVVVGRFTSFVSPSVKQGFPPNNGNNNYPKKTQKAPDHH